MAKIVINHGSDTITLADLARKVEDDGRGYSDAVKHVKTGHWDNFADFMSYFDAHYRPLLKELQQDAVSRQMRFFASDMLEIFGE